MHGVQLSSPVLPAGCGRVRTFPPVQASASALQQELVALVILFWPSFPSSLSPSVQHIERNACMRGCEQKDVILERHKSNTRRRGRKQRPRNTCHLAKADLPLLTEASFPLSLCGHPCFASAYQFSAKASYMPCLPAMFWGGEGKSGSRLLV